MKTLFTLMSGILLFAGINAQAATKSEIFELVRRIDSELRYYEQSPEVLEFTKAKMEEALQTLRGGPVQDPNACLDYAFAEYRKDGFSASTSMEKAKTFCTKAADAGMTMEAITFLYEHLRLDGYSATTSLVHTLNLGLKMARAELSCVRSAFERYSQDGFSRRTSLEKSVEFCGR